MNPLFLLSHSKTPPPLSLYPHRPLQFRNTPAKFSSKPCLSRSSISLPIPSPSPSPSPRIHGHSRFEAPAYTSSKDETFITSMEIGGEEEDLSSEGAVYRKTLRLVECSMFAALAGLVYFLSNSLSIENYFGCFFPLPIVLSSMRWGIAAGRKTMVATAMLLLVLSGPLKALTYLESPLAVNTRFAWFCNGIFVEVRAMGALGYVSVTSFLIKENILGLITISLHASVSFILTASGINSIPSMNLIYAIFGFVLLLNSIFLVFLLHLLYAVFFTRLGMRASLRLPRWLEKAI